VRLANLCWKAANNNLVGPDNEGHNQDEKWFSAMWALYDAGATHSEIIAIMGRDNVHEFSQDQAYLYLMLLHEYYRRLK